MSSPRHAHAWQGTWPRRSTTRFRPWSLQELQQLRTLAQEGVPLTRIADTLRRSKHAVRNKAGIHGISLRLPNPDQ